VRRVPEWKKLHRIAGRASHVEATARLEDPGCRLQSKTDDGRDPIIESGVMLDTESGLAGVKSAGACSLEDGLHACRIIHAASLWLWAMKLLAGKFEPALPVKRLQIPLSH
jgi:hypothetical protein